jgi:hypothetical protein
VKKTKIFNEDATLRGAWRRVFARSPIVKEVMEEGKRYVDKFKKDGTKAKRQAVEYHCQVGDHWVRASVKGKKNIAVDHIVPVIGVTNIEGKVTDWNEFKRKLFCEKNNLQRICKEHHNMKTQQESLLRRINKYNEELNTLEQEIREKDHEDIDYIVKALKKFSSKTKPEEIRNRALKLRELIK